LDKNNRELMERARAGDRQAASDLSVLHGPEVYRLARYLLNSTEEARDAAADIFAKLFASPGTIPTEGFRPWLLKVAYNHCMDILRRRRVLMRLLPKVYFKTSANMDPPLDEAVVESDEREEVRRVVGLLPEPDRAVVILRYYQQMRYSEISKILDIPEATVGSRLHRAREKIRKVLEKNEGVGEI